MKTPLVILAAVHLAATAEPLKLESLMIGGTEYRSATVAKVDEMTARITHEGGVSRIPFEKLPEELRERAGFDPVAAEAAKMKQVQAAIEKRLRQELAAKSSRVVIEVLSVHPGGLLGRYWLERDSRHRYHSGTDVFIETDTEGRGFVSEGSYRFAVMKVGVFEYKTVTGASRTVHRMRDYTKELEGVRGIRGEDR